EARRFVGESRNFAALGRGKRALTLQQVLARRLERRDAALLLPAARVEPVGLRLQRFLAREIGFQPRLRPAMLRQETRVAPRQGIEKGHALDERRDVPRFEQDPQIPEASEPMEETSAR